ncbi:MAG: hypothetical protein BRD57_04110 [Proteobacteria bacterium SW_6_67_9]|nr:MAG: hypothetical protein BRD57_04110 [Proteobacteria bacterium SW_6_67_9]
MSAIDDHIAARDSDTPLVVDIPEGAAQGRLVAELYRLDDGRLVFADVGWAVPDNPSHPFHVLAAPPDDEGPSYEPSDESYLLRPILPGLEPELVEQWQRWREVRGELEATRERGRRVVEEMIGPTDGT